MICARRKNTNLQVLTNSTGKTWSAYRLKKLSPFMLFSSLFLLSSFSSLVFLLFIHFPLLFSSPLDLFLLSPSFILLPLPSFFFTLFFSSSSLTFFLLFPSFLLLPLFSFFFYLLISIICLTSPLFHSLNLSSILLFISSVLPSLS